MTEVYMLHNFEFQILFYNKRTKPVVCFYSTGQVQGNNMILIIWYCLIAWLVGVNIASIDL